MAVLSFHERPAHGRDSSFTPWSRCARRVTSAAHRIGCGKNDCVECAHPVAGRSRRGFARQGGGVKVRLVMQIARLWQKLTSGAVRRAREESQMSPSERTVAREGIEGLQADEFVAERLGGTDPRRLLDL